MVLDASRARTRIEYHFPVMSHRSGDALCVCVCVGLCVFFVSSQVVCLLVLIQISLRMHGTQRRDTVIRILIFYRVRRHSAARLARACIDSKIRNKLSTFLFVRHRHRCALSAPLTHTHTHTFAYRENSHRRPKWSLSISLALSSSGPREMR